MNTKNYTSALLVGLFMMMLPVLSYAQLSKSEIPKQVLVETKPNTPRHMEFSGDKLTIHTDPSKTTGKQYMVEYSVKWNGKKFNLTSIQEISTSINDKGEEVTTTAKKSDFFGYSYLKNWSLTKNEEGNFILASDVTADYEWIFKVE